MLRQVKDADVMLGALRSHLQGGLERHTCPAQRTAAGLAEREAGCPHRGAGGCGPSILTAGVVTRSHTCSGEKLIELYTPKGGFYCVQIFKKNYVWLMKGEEILLTVGGTSNPFHISMVISIDVHRGVEPPPAWAVPVLLGLSRGL